MVIERNARIKYYRLIKKMRATFDILHTNGKITDAEKAEWLSRCEELYSEWRAKLREARKPFLKRPGRPRTEIPRNTVYPFCKKPGCERPSAPQQAYCSKECAPFAEYGRDWFKRRKTGGRKQQQE